MKPISDYKLKAIAQLLVPDLGREPTQEEVQKAPATLRHTKAVPVRDIAQELQVDVNVLKYRIRLAGIQPAKKGGPSGRENCYDMRDILNLMQA